MLRIKIIPKIEFFSLIFYTIIWLFENISFKINKIIKYLYYLNLNIESRSKSLMISIILPNSSKIYQKQLDDYFVRQEAM